MNLAEYSMVLFYVLKNAGYLWQPQGPDRLIELRKNFKQFRPLIQWFGLGQAVSFEELIQDGLPASILQNLMDLKLVQAEGNLVHSLLAISNAKNTYILHSHWPPDPSCLDEYVYFGPESVQLSQKINPYREQFVRKDILDLGCSSGGISLNLDSTAQEVLGIDRSKKAIAWARATACAYAVKNIHFEQATIGESDAETLTGKKQWDIVIINPPMAIPTLGALHPYRNGGKFGIEMPLKFIDFGYRHLKPQGEVFCLITNPIVDGKSLFFEALPTQWKLLEKQCLNEHFNQSIAKKEGYDKLGIERIELWFLHLKKL